jgi:excisionase family DNA binding protein
MENSAAHKRREQVRDEVRELVSDSRERPDIPLLARQCHASVRLFRLQYSVCMAALTGKERDRARRALLVLGAHPTITAEDGTALELPSSVVAALAEILEAAADGKRALVLRSPEDLTTEQAAAVLGVSRPTVVRLIESGKLPARMVGTHRRLSLSDVLAHREASAKRRNEALDDMARDAEELGLYD